MNLCRNIQLNVLAFPITRNGLSMDVISAVCSAMCALWRVATRDQIPLLLLQS